MRISAPNILTLWRRNPAAEHAWSTLTVGADKQLRVR